MNPADAESAYLARVAALGRIDPFDRVREVELALLAEVAVARTFAPGALVHHGGTPLARLLLVTRGTLRDEAGRAAGPVCGLGSLFDGTPVGALTADATTGVEVLWISKHAFFTLARECPELIRGFLESGAAGAAG